MIPVRSRPAAQWNSVATPACRLAAITSKVPLTADRPPSRLFRYTFASSAGSSEGNGSRPSLPSASTENRCTGTGNWVSLRSVSAFVRRSMIVPMPSLSKRILASAGVMLSSESPR